MERKENRQPRVYYLRVVKDENGELTVAIEDKVEIGVPYTTMEIIDEKGTLHIFFWRVAEINIKKAPLGAGQ